jgi:hypothetical protein
MKNVRFDARWEYPFGWTLSMIEWAPNQILLLDRYRQVHQNAN